MWNNVLPTTALTMGILLLVAIIVVPTIWAIFTFTTLTLIETSLLVLAVSSIGNLVGRILRW
jgi:hypothetical protein